MKSFTLVAAIILLFLLVFAHAANRAGRDLANERKVIVQMILVHIALHSWSDQYGLPAGPDGARQFLRTQNLAVQNPFNPGEPGTVLFAFGNDPDPELKPGQVLVRVSVSGGNYLISAQGAKERIPEVLDSENPQAFLERVIEGEEAEEWPLTF